MRRPLTSRRILAASIGVATVSYVVATSACSSQGGVGNLMAPDFGEAGDPSQRGDSGIGNLIPGEASVDAADAADATQEAVDATIDAGDATDAGVVPDAPIDSPADG